MNAEGQTYSIEHTWPWPPWVTLLFLLAAAAFVGFIYFTERGGLRPKELFVKLVAGLIRFSLVAILVTLLYGWMLHRHRTDLPDVIVMLDDSESMNALDQYDDEKLRAALDARVKAAGLNQVSRLNLAKTLLVEKDAALLKTLQNKYNLKFYLVGESARVQATEGTPLVERVQKLKAEQTASRLGKGLRDVLESQRGRPTAAVIVLTDGATTDGKSLGEAAEYARRKAVPLFAIGLGSDKSPRDVRLSDLLVDEVVFVGDMVNFDVRLAASGYEGKEVTVRLKTVDSPSVLAEKTVKFGKDGEAQTVRLAYRPAKKGEFEYVVEVEPLEGEVNPANNRQSRVVSVRDETIRVLLVQAYPSYEFRYLKHLLSRQLKSGDKSEKSIELRTVLQEADQEWNDDTAERVFPVNREELFKYDVLIFGDVNPNFLSASVMTNIADFVKVRGGGVVFIAGSRYTPLAYRDTPLAELFPIDLSSARAPDVGASLKQAFAARPTRLGFGSPQLQLGETPADSLRVWQNLPGMYWLLETPDLRPGARVLVEHPTRTGNDGQNLPVVSLQYVGAGKVIFHATDETHRWRFRVGDKYFGRYWVQTIRYLSRSKLLGQSRAAELTSDREEYRRGEAVRLRVRFFDDRLAPPQDDGVSVMLEREGSKRRSVKLSRDAGGRGIFEGSLTNLPDGQYRVWVAAPTLEGQPPSRAFSIVAPPGEQARLEMDSTDLKQAAKISLGRFYTISDVDRLARELPRGRQVRIESLPPVPIWNWWPFALAFVALIVSEWLLRKSVGML